jgi:imidazolonepropionase-like amidohydrolase
MGRTVLTNANLFDGEHPPEPDSAVVVERNRIVEVTSGPVAVREGDDVVDLRGRTLMPGMVSGHFHSTYHDVGATQLPFGLERPPAYQAFRAAANARLALEKGFTTVVGASAAFDIDASLAAAIRDGLVVGPRVIAGSRDLITTGDSNDTLPWWYEAKPQGVVRLCDGPAEFRHAVRDEIKRGAEVVKVYVTGGHGVLAPPSQVSLARDELQAVVEAAHGRGKRVRGHVATKRAILECVELGVDIIDHADGMDDECIAAFVDAGTVVLPSLYLPLKILQLMGDAPGANTMGFTTDTGREFAHMCEMLGRAVAAGVTIAVGDDFGSSLTPHGHYAEELRVYVEHAGIPALEVLRWATRNGAVLAGLTDQIGVVAPGRLADLVVVDGDPSVDIGVLRDGIAGVMKDGAFVVSPA